MFALIKENNQINICWHNLKIYKSLLHQIKPQYSKLKNRAHNIKNIYDNLINQATITYSTHNNTIKYISPPQHNLKTYHNIILKNIKHTKYTAKHNRTKHYILMK